MTDLVTSAQMRAIERAAIESGDVTGLELMDRAGAGAVAAMLARWPGLSQALVLCGPGNNGGDGFVIARLLAARGLRVSVFLLGDPLRLPPDARAMYDAWQDKHDLAWQGLAHDALVGAAMQACADDGADAGDGGTGVVVVDALFGIGMTRPSRDAELLLQGTQALDQRGDALGFAVFRVAVDIPTGLDADTGHLLRPAGDEAWSASTRRYDLTVTFHALRPGHVFEAGPDICGAVVVASLGLTHKAQTHCVQGPLCALEKRSGHKFDHGHSVVVAGGTGKGGAARLAARAALRVGAGLVTLACPPEALTENAARLDAVMVSTDPLALLADKRVTSLVIGPGLGVDARAKALLAAVIGSGRPCVLDADALTLLAQDEGLRSQLHGNCVLTPHMGEFARLLPALAVQMQGPTGGRASLSRIEAARLAAEAVKAVVVLKGPTTVIAAPDRLPAFHPAIYDRAAPWLATAGSGDVLAGIIAGLLARGTAPFEAAATGVWLHVEAARAFGPGLIAEDLPEALPQVLSRGL